MKIWLETYKNLGEAKLSALAAHRDMLGVRLRPNEPGEAFLDGLRDSVRKAWRWEEPGQPEITELERILDEENIAGEQRRVCLRCANGLSNRQIAEQPDISKKTSWIQEQLQNLRSDPRFKRLLPVHRPGRRKTT